MKDSFGLSEVIMDELLTKSTLTFNAWADTGDGAVIYLGGNEICLKEHNSAKFDNKSFVD